MSKFYAQIDENKKCFAVSEVSGIVASPFLIEIDSFDEAHIGLTFPAAKLPKKSDIAAKVAAKAAARKSRRDDDGWI